MNDTSSLNVLIVEDSEDDALLILRELRRSGYTPDAQRVYTAAAMRAALAEHAWDIILSDYVLPGFGGLEALGIVKDSGADLPFILVSNKVSEETLVEAMRAGATDFLMKDRLDRLGPVVRRELTDAAARRGLKQAQFEWKTAFDAVQDPIFVHDAEFRIVRANLAYAALSGVPIAEIIGKPYWEVFPRLDGPLPGCRSVMATGGMTEERIDCADGTIFSSRSFAVSDRSGKHTFSVHVMQDVTERNRVQEALAKSERHFRSLLEHASDLVAVVAMNGTITYISPSVKQLGDYEVDEVLGKNYLGLVHPEDAPAAAAGYAEIIRDPGLLHKTEFRFRRKDGTWTVLESVARNALADPLINGIVINSRDITERNRTQAALANSEKNLKAIFDAAGDGIVLADTESRKFQAVNASLCRMLGYSMDELLKLGVSDIHPAEDLPNVVRQFELQANGEIDLAPELPVKRKDGSVFFAEINSTPVTLDGKSCLLGIFRDVTERKRAQEELRRLNWALRALGQSNSALVHAGTEAELFRSCCDAIAGSEGYPLAWIGLARDDAAHSVEIVAAAGAATKYLDDFAVSWADEPMGRGPTGTSIRTGVPQVTNNLAQSSAYLPWIESARAHGLASSISLPLYADGAVIGALALYSREPDAFGQREVDLFEELAADIGYGISARRTRVAYEAGLVEREIATRKLRSAFESLIAVLAATVERRDPYTAGHQRRVAELASAIAQVLGLDPARIEGLHFAATIHDIGKIYVPAEILARPGKLGAMEFELVKAHAQVGFDIVKDVDFPWQVADMIRQHHERLDGSGYPQGLKGEQILLESRILAVADVVEAMSSDRPYRPGLGLDAALAQIRLEAGTKLDAQAVDACARLFREQGFSFSEA